MQASFTNVSWLVQYSYGMTRPTNQSVYLDDGGLLALLLTYWLPACAIAEHFHENHKVHRPANITKHPATKVTGMKYTR